MNQRMIPLPTSKILARVENGVGWIVINNPERRNAVSREMWQGIADAAAALNTDPLVRVVVIRGAGDKAFASGADISEFEEVRANACQKGRYDESSTRGNTALRNLAVPLIAMVQGYCIGGGLVIALNADIRFAAAGSTFGIPAARLGLGYGYEGTSLLARLVGPAVAKDMLFSGRHLGADEALRLGLVNFVVDGALIEQEVQAYAARIAANAPLTIRAAKEAVRLFERYSADVETSAVERLVNDCFDSDDYREGRRAFMEKRLPTFEGH